jgi:hypothetical protein
MKIPPLSIFAKSVTALFFKKIVEKGVYTEGGDTTFFLTHRHTGHIVLLFFSETMCRMCLCV